MIVAAALVIGCSDEAHDDHSGDTETTSDATATDETSGASSPALVVPEEFRLCSVPASGKSLDDEFFRNRAILELTAGRYAFGEPPLAEVSPINVTLSLDVGGTLADIETSESTLEVLPDTVPSLLYLNVDPAPGYATAHYRAAFGADGVASELNLWMGQLPEQIGSDFDVGPLVDADLSRLRLVHIAGIGHGLYAPCDGPVQPPDRVDVVLSVGMVSFYTRPAVWGGRDGFTVRASGEVDGVAIEVVSYWDLEYSSRSFEHAYGLLPTLGVRFDEQPGSECILIVAHDAQNEEYVAALLDCEQQHLRDVQVESVTFVAGGD